MPDGSADFSDVAPLLHIPISIAHTPKIDPTRKCIKKLMISQVPRQKFLCGGVIWPGLIWGIVFLCPSHVTIFVWEEYVQLQGVGKHSMQ